MPVIKHKGNQISSTPLKRESHGVVYHRGGGYQEVFLTSNKLVLMFSERAWQPPTDIYETDTEIIIKIEIAGIKPEALDIKLNEDQLNIKGERVDRKTQGKRVFRQMEINYGRFERDIIIHGAYDGQNTKAAYKNGFLEIIIAKAKKSKPATKQIDIIFEV